MARQFVREIGVGKIELVEKDWGGFPLPPVDVLVLGAHNDDEMFPGGHLIHAIDRGKRVGVVVATDGAGSSYHGVSGQGLVDLRTEESRKALTALGAAWFIGYDHTSSHLKSGEGLASFAGELTAVLNATNPGELLVQTPIEDHYTHLRTTEAGVIAARMADIKPGEVLGYDVWTPQLRLPLVQLEPLDEVTANMKLGFQSRYQTQNEANPYHEATRALNLFYSIMADSHKAAGLGYAEAFLDMNPLVHDERFKNVTAVEYGGGLLLLSQAVKASEVVQVHKKTLSKEQLVDLLVNNFIPAYKTASILLDGYAANPR